MYFWQPLPKSRTKPNLETNYCIHTHLFAGCTQPCDERQLEFSHEWKRKSEESATGIFATHMKSLITCNSLSIGLVSGLCCHSLLRQVRQSSVLDWYHRWHTGVFVGASPVPGTPCLFLMFGRFVWLLETECGTHTWPCGIARTPKETLPWKGNPANETHRNEKKRKEKGTPKQKPLRLSEASKPVARKGQVEGSEPEVSREPRNTES